MRTNHVRGQIADARSQKTGSETANCKPMPSHPELDERASQLVIGTWSLVTRGLRPRLMARETRPAGSPRRVEYCVPVSTSGGVRSDFGVSSSGRWANV